MTGAPLSIRLRTPSGVKPLTLPLDATFQTLGARAADAAGLVAATLVLRAGFPPRPLDLASASLVSSVLQSGEMVIAQGDAANGPGPSTPAVPIATTAPAAPAPSPGYDSITVSGNVVQRVVPDDNSCLFRSVAGIVYNQQNTAPEPLRRICANAVAADPVFYSTDLLQKPNAEYCKWIMRDTSWGGEIELAILSKHFEVELAAWDIGNMVIHRYGEGQYGTVGYLAYDGLHYNFLALEIPGIPDVTKFPSDDPVAYAKVEELVRAQHVAGSFTNTSTFKLNCEQCGVIVRGEVEAQAHGNATGHTQFSECN
jgi:ubiquitin thioesterase OTU1